MLTRDQLVAVIASTGHFVTIPGKTTHDTARFYSALIADAILKADAGGKPVSDTIVVTNEKE